MRSDVEFTNFTAGELSPRMKGRIDHKNYYNACDTLQNMVVMPQGGATERPGTLFVAKNKAQASFARLVRFIFSTIQPYILEFSDENVRVYMNHGVVLSGMTPVDIAAPYRTADLKALKFTQSADTLTITHPGYPPANLTRSSHTAWTYAVIAFRDGPYLDENSTDNAVTPSGNSGAITLTWDSTAGINGGAGFTGADVGRVVRIKLFSLWAWCVITAVTNTTTVSALVQSKVNDGAAGAIDGVSWAAATDYVTGTVVLGLDLATYYVAVTGGRSAGNNGPQGPGSQILDGTVIWSSLSARNADNLRRSTFYDVNDIVVTAAGSYYQATNSGETDSGGGAVPSGSTPPLQTDGTIKWAYLSPFTFPTKTKNWALGVWCAINGYPAASRYWQARQHFAGAASYPSRIDGSQTGDFTNSAPSNADGTVIASNAVSWTIDDDQVNAIQALIGAGSAQAMQLGMFTQAGEHILQAASSSQSLSPTSVQAYNETAYGSAVNVDPLRIGKSVLFVDRTGRKLREWSFAWQANGYLGPDLLQSSEHITRAPAGSAASLSGLFWMDYQQAPHQVIWAGRNDGCLLSFTYDRDQQVFAPVRHRLGGDYYGGPPVVESGAVIPTPDGTYDELWLSVLRTIAGVPTRTVEVMAAYFDGQPKDLAYFVDCGVASTPTAPSAGLTVTGLIDDEPDTMPSEFAGMAILATDADVFVSGNVGAILRVNGGKIAVTAVSGPRAATGAVLEPLNSLAPAASGAWSLDGLHSGFSGLDHLIGETVTIWGDGTDMGTAVVDDSGAAAIGNADQASIAAIGLFYRPVLVTMPWEPSHGGAAAAQGKLKRPDYLYARFHETIGARFGRRVTDPATDVQEDKIETLEQRQSSGRMDDGPPLYSGIRRLTPQGGTDQEGQFIFTRDGAGPLTVLGIFARGNVSEMPQP